MRTLPALVVILMLSLVMPIRIADGQDQEADGPDISNPEVKDTFLPNVLS